MWEIVRYDLAEHIDKPDFSLDLGGELIGIEVPSLPRAIDDCDIIQDDRTSHNSAY